MPRTKRDINLRHRYHITEAEYDALLAKQGGRCLICGRPPAKRRLSVDHDHRTGEVRGLLCFWDNRFLVPAIEKHPQRVERAIRYLARKLKKPPTRPI